ncbi:hypothetical protein BGZ99_003191, partial [Dissophora globulifera]
GGWGLINVRSQCQALKAKWLYQWRTSRPRWRDLFTISVIQANPDKAATIDSFLSAPPPTINIPTPAEAHVIVPGINNDLAIGAFASLDPVQTIVPDAPAESTAEEPLHRMWAPPILHRPALGADTVFGNGTSLPEFTIKAARSYIDDKIHEANKDNTDAKISKRPPVYAHMRLKKVDELGVPAGSLSEVQWDRAFQRLHARQRRPVEKHFLYQIAHNVIWTNAVKHEVTKHYQTQTSPNCRRCKPVLPPGVTQEEVGLTAYVANKADIPVPANIRVDLPAYETREHAFYWCPPVRAMWTQVRAWLKAIFPRQQWSANATQVLLAWPGQKDVPPLALHIHSAAAHALWRTYCKLGDGEKLYKDQLMTITVHGIKERARVELARAL